MSKARHRGQGTSAAGGGTAGMSALSSFTVSCFAAAATRTVSVDEAGCAVESGTTGMIDDSSRDGNEAFGGSSLRKAAGFGNGIKDRVAFARSTVDAGIATDPD